MHLRSLVALASVAFAVLFGQITDRTTGQPLPNVGVTIGSHHTTTDAHGKYTLPGIAPGAHRLSVTSDDVPLQHENVNVQSPDTTFDFKVCSTTLDYGCGSVSPGPG